MGLLLVLEVEERSARLARWWPFFTNSSNSFLRGIKKREGGEEGGERERERERKRAREK
jgi:hypothetical protein